MEPIFLGLFGLAVIVLIVATAAGLLSQHPGAAAPAPQIEPQFGHCATLVSVEEVAGKRREIYRCNSCGGVEVREVS